MPSEKVVSPVSFPLSCESFDTSSTFVDNMKLPVHRWFRFSAGFSAKWVETVIIKAKEQEKIAVLDPFAGSGTTLLASEQIGVECYGIEAHPFVTRVARAKLLYRTDPDAYLQQTQNVVRLAENLKGCVNEYPNLIRECFTDPSLNCLDRLRQAWEKIADDSPPSELVWLTLVAILRHVSHAGTAPWQYILPNKKKQSPLEPMAAFQLMAESIATDMRIAGKTVVSQATLIQSDARTCQGVPDDFANLVITSPPYANNYDYADATRLEMCFMGEIQGWGDLQSAVRQHLVRSCSQHVTQKTVNLEEILASPELQPIQAEILAVCNQLSQERRLHGGKKNYHLMVGCYFADMAKVWLALRRVCKSPSTVCFVIGDSAPYGVHVPVIEWLGKLAQSAGFEAFEFEKIRDRNVKWKNRKHRIPLCEGCLWVRG